MAKGEEDDHSDDDDDAPHPDWVPALATLLANIFDVVQMPCALASGNRGLSHKCAADVFHWALFHCNTPLSEQAGTVVGHTADTGTEVGIADFILSTYEALEALLPPWLIQPSLQTFESWQSDDAWARVSLDIEGNFDQEDLLPPQGRVPAVTAERKATTFIFNSLSWIGLQHTSSIVCSEVHKTISHWNEFYEQLENTEALLRVHDRRHRFNKSCMDDGDTTFKVWDASLYEAWWREVIRFLQGLLSRFRKLVSRWGEATPIVLSKPQFKRNRKPTKVS